MIKKYALLSLLISCLTSQLAQAQFYTFNDAVGGLSSYRQNFDGLSGSVALTGNHLSSFPEIYAEAEFPGYPPGYDYYVPGTINANDGSNSVGNYYHFGYASGDNSADRAFGGIAAVSTNNGIGYVGIRFKNATTSTVIKNLEVQYAMEQWYNSGRQDAAQVDVSYLTGAPVASLLAATGSWVSIPALQVKAPSTATVIANRDGNSAANRRLVSATVMGLNLAPGQEIMLRWAYTLNTSTNGNGLSIDDVVVTPETGVFYSTSTGQLNDVQNWSQNSDGTGTHPANFTDDYQVFYVQGGTPSANPAYVPSTGTNPTADRLGTATWTVSGKSSKIIVGTAASPATLMVEFNKNVSGIIDVSTGSLFVHRHTPSTTLGNPAFTLGTLASNSYVEYNSGSTVHSIQPNQYSNLRITGNNTDRALNAKNLFGSTIVTGTLLLNGGSNSGSNLVLGNNDLTVLSSGNITGGAATAYVVTNGTGRLRVLVPRASATAAGPVITFPLGSSLTSYTPVTLQQTTLPQNNSDDVFEVRVIDGAYRSYDATTYAPVASTQATSQLVNKTWLVSKEVPGNAANVTMTTQWTAAEASTDFIPAKAHINHYTGGGWDTYTAEMGSTGTGPYVMKRSGITSFSPFGVSSQAAGTLPVELTAFGAQRSGSGVRCTWSTASEHNSKNFSVERSLNGKIFTALGSVPAAGSSVTPRSYAFLDAQPAATTAYYRLRQTDFDGQSTVSAVVVVAGTTVAGATTAAPNPTAGPLDIAATSVTQATVLNVLGVSVLTQQLAAPAPHIALDLSGLPAGMYLVRLATANGPQVVRVTKL